MELVEAPLRRMPIASALVNLVVAVPNVVFYDNKDEGRHLVRFTFCKKPEVLQGAIDRLATLGAGDG